MVANYDKELIKQTITKDTSDFLRQALVNTVNGGTGKTAAVEGYDVGGKTGTAQHHDKSDTTYLLSFLGFAPYDNPRVVCYTIVDAPQVDNPGSSSYACKLFSAIMTEALPYMDVFPTKEVQTTEPATEPETTKPEETQESTEPTVPMSPSEDEAYEDNSPIVEDVEPSGDNVTTTTE